MIQGAQLMAFTATSQPERSLAFYRDVVGLGFVSDDAFALVFESGATLLRVQKVEGHQALPYTTLGWTVPDLQLAVRELAGRGARFERFPGMAQDGLGIWESPSGARVAWFKDPDGNVLSLTQF